ncbi:peptidase M23 [Synergistales bacterium]|nr:peptidase M23 [Synergistales bacterium]GHV57087.1 peptidase M23 [Synergistales bacterium]
MMTKLKLRAIFSVILAMCIVCLAVSVSCAAAPQTQGDIEKQLKAEELRYKKIQSQIDEAKRKKDEAAQQEKKVIRDLNNLSSEMSKAEQRINITVLKRNQVSAKISDIHSRINGTSKNINYAKDLLRDRVVAMYKYGGLTEFNLFMSAEGARDALATSYMLAKIADQDKALIGDLYKQKSLLDKAHNDLLKQRSELENRDKELKKEKSLLQKTSQERNKLLQQVRKDKALFEAQQEELLRASRELQEKVKQLLSAKKKLQLQNNGKTTPFYYKGGKLAWPLRGSINSPYGTRVHPVFKTKTTHTGIDIAGKKGDPVRAASDGEVLYTGWLRGYGQVVIIDHGGDLTTVYAHLSGIDTNENAKVKMGDQVGRVGSTGVTTGNNLHFEVRVNGNTVDPMGYLGR